MARGVNTKANGIDFRANRFDEFLKLIPQNLTAAEKAQVLANIGAIGEDDTLMTINGTGVKKGDEVTTAETAIVVDGEMSGSSTNPVQNKVISRSLNAKVDAKSGKNLYNNLTNLKNHLINSSGAFSANNTYSVTDYIAVNAGDTIYASCSAGKLSTQYGFVNYYNEDYELVETVSGDAFSFLIPENVRYVRFSFPNSREEVQIEKGSSRTSYEPYNPIAGYNAKMDEAVRYDIVQTLTQEQQKQGRKNICALSQSDFDLVTELVKGKNLLDVNSEEILEGNYMSSIIQPNASYFLSAPIAVEPGKTYVFSSSHPVSITPRYIAFLASRDSQRSLSYSEGLASVVVPDGCRYVRLTILNTYRTYNLQFEEGNTATSYEAYFDPYIAVNKLVANSVNTANVKNRAITREKIADGVRLPASPQPFGALSSGALAVASGETINTQFIHGNKNTCIIANISGEIEEIAIGVGKGIYYQYKIVVTPTSVTGYSGENETQTFTEDHGLTLTEETEIVISRPVLSSESKITLHNGNGESWSKTINFNGQGRPFLTNDGEESVTAKLDYVLRDINEKIWMFGDSYFNTDSDTRWTYHMLQDGYTSNLLSSQGGDAADAALQSFQSLLATGARPSYAVWCMGMNGTADSGDTPNATWLADTQSFIALCEANGIVPILTTIPTVPSRNHAGRNAWIASQEYRYIDFAAAVEVEGSTSWKNWGTAKAMLSSDEVHPTAYGAKALWQRVVRDFPEIMILK